MMKLTTQSLGKIDNGYAVAWYTGKEKKGFFIVNNVNIADPMVVAELIVIRYLFLIENIFKRNIITGTGYEICISSPVIKKLCRGKSTKNHLLPYVNFLKSKLKGVDIVSKRKHDDMLPLQGKHPFIHINNNLSDTTDDLLFDTPSLGKIKLTTHAIEQYQSRLESGEVNDPTKSLVRRLKHKELIKQALPARVIRHKLKKYGTVDNLEVWGHDSSSMHYMLIRDKLTDIGTIVTVYSRGIKQ
ncbi:MAG: hypothetical protein HN826_02485 [Methylococcales bacterium]|jgi:hypothetical protein|nr:hypothetical protein [Methylococcales bacterium]